MNTITNTSNKTFKLDNNADFDLGTGLRHGTVYVIIPTKDKEISVEVYFEASWTGKVTLVSIGDIYELDGEYSDYVYTMSEDDEVVIKNTISKFIKYSNQDDIDDNYQERDTMGSLGFTNDDFLYGN